MKELFEHAAALAREHARETLSQKDREQICYRMGRDTIVEALRSELEVIIALLPLQDDAAKERRALLAHLREWLEER